MSDSSPLSEDKEAVATANVDASLSPDSLSDAVTEGAAAAVASNDDDDSEGHDAIAAGGVVASTGAALEPMLTLHVAEIEADAEHAAQHEHHESDPTLVIMEAATPSLPGLEPLVATGDVDTELATATALVTVTSAASARASSRRHAEVTSDDILETQAASNDAAAADEKKRSSSGADEKPTDVGATGESEASAESAQSEAKDSSASLPPTAGELKPKHTNMDDATAKMIEAYVP